MKFGSRTPTELVFSRRYFFSYHTLWVWLLLLTACSGGGSEEKEVVNPVQIKYTVKSRLPHDTKSFTEGFFIHEGQLYESTGLDSSWVGILNAKTGKPDKKVILSNEYFGEGITLLNNKIYQLTWQTHKGFVYNATSFEKLREFSYTTEGWGFTNDGINLIMSDGTDKLYYMDTTTFAVVRMLKVTNQGVSLQHLNELEYVNGDIYANVWQANQIVKIDAKSGAVTGVLDLTVLMQEAHKVNPGTDVLNGIAWYDKTETLLVTGKYWPYIYVLKLEE